MPNPLFRVSLQPAETVLFPLYVFKKVATTLVDLLFVQLLFHLSHVKQMNSQLTHLTHELMLCVQITRGRVHFSGDSAVKSARWH